ncbi:MAG: DNA polymerase IV [Clostridia bacterium]|nr:DNA polymerase IV [Clostridia bacterium]
MSDRIIFHCDCNSFFASCEELLYPELKKVPMAVTGDPENRHGIILAKNQLAKKYDIRTAETIWQARRKCPDLVCVLAHHGYYGEISNQINQIYLDYTDLTEPASIDESFLDVTNTIHLFGKSPRELADTIRERVRTEIGVTISVGVSFCKTVAKFGSDYKKPDATTVIMREDLPGIFWKAPVGDMLMAGRKTTDRLAAFGIRTIGDLANTDRELLKRSLGKTGELLHDYANGADDEPVHSYYETREVKSVGNSMTFRRDIKGEEELRAGIAALADSVAGRLRADHKKCTVVQIGVKDTSFKTVQKQRTLHRATDLQKEITDIAFELLRSCWDLNSPVRLLSVTGSGLIGADDDYMQFDLFSQKENDPEKQGKIEDTIDTIRKRYGKNSIKFGHFPDEETGIR